MNRYGPWAVIVALIAAAPLRAQLPPDSNRTASDGQRPFTDHYRLAALWGQPPAHQTPHPAVARVIAVDRNSMSLGSGTLVDANDQYGLVITNWHVVRDAVGPIEVLFPDGFHSLAQVVRTDREWDLAALLIWKPPVQPVPISSTAPRPGDPLAIAGYGSGNYLMQSGLCTEYLAPAPGRPLEIVELSAAARHGDSGGPILNSRGELAGVLFGEGGGRTDGSYCGRVHKFLELCAVDLQRLPTANIASNNQPPKANQVAQNNVLVAASPAYAVARFDGGIGATESAPAGVASASDSTAGWTEALTPRVASRTSVGGEPYPQEPQSQPLAMATPNQSFAARSSTVFAALAMRGISALSGYKGELKSLLAAFGVAAIVVHLLPARAPKRNRKRK